MKLLKRLFIKKNYIQKAVNFEFTKNHTSNIVLFYYNDNSKNITVLKDCLSLYDYDKRELKSYLEKLQSELTSHIEWKSKNYKRLSQSALGNWAGKKFDLESMIKVLENNL